MHAPYAANLQTMKPFIFSKFVATKIESYVHKTDILIPLGT